MASPLINVWAWLRSEAARRYSLPYSWPCSSSSEPRPLPSTRCSSSSRCFQSARRCSRNADRSMKSLAFLLPQPRAADERIVVVAGTCAGRELIEFLGVAAAEHHVLHLQGLLQARHHVENRLVPFLLAQPPHPFGTHVFLKCFALFVRQMSQFHRTDDAIENQCGTQAGAQAEKEHAAALIA